MTDGAMRVCIAVPTFRRPDLLEALLEGLALQSVDAAYAIEVLVIDNDERPSVDALVRSFAPRFPFALSYRHVPEPGLSSVRNVALAYGLAHASLLAMIDDDECPEPQWLAELLRVQARTHATAVVGPVPRRMPADAPRWIRTSHFYDLPTYPDEANITFGYSGNCLLDTSALRALDLRFDAQLNLAGGEDMLFFRELIARGGTIAYAARATASEWVGRDRLRASYLLKLNFRRGNTLSVCDRRLRGTVLGLATRASKSLARLCLGLVSLIPLSFACGKAGGMRALCDVAQGLGALIGLTGHVHQGYKRVDVARG